MESMGTHVAPRHTRHGDRGRSPLHSLAFLLAMATVALVAIVPTATAQEAARPAPAIPLTAPDPDIAQPLSAAPKAERDLLAKYQPYFRFTEFEECGPSSYRPMDVTTLLDNRQVVLRGPWDRVNVVKIAPAAEDLSDGLPGYHLDLPGDALRPDKCVYYDLQTSLLKKKPATVYGHVAYDPAVPDRVAVQYYFFYVFNDWKDRHEGDWEMIQLEFPVSTAEEALATDPDVVAFSQHNGAHVLPWGDSQMAIVDGTHPVVFPGAGSHASYSRAGMFIARGGTQGLGCDDARGTETIEQTGLTVLPSDEKLAIKEQPWLGFEGRWGELRQSFYNGPTGPNAKLQWSQPFEWSSHRAAHRPAARMPSTSLSLTPATDAFCEMVSGGATLAQVGFDRPAVLIFCAVLVLTLIGFAASRTRWQPSNPLHLGRERRLGQIFTAAGRIMREHPLTVLGVGLVAIPVGIVAALAQLTADFIDPAGTSSFVRTGLGTLLIWIGTSLPVIGFIVIIAAGAWLVQQYDQGKDPTARAALRHVLPRLPLLGIPLVALLIAQFITEFSLVFAIVFTILVIRIALAPVILGVEGDPDSTHPLLKSIRLTRGHTWRTTVVVLGVAGVGLIIGPSIGVLAMILTGWSFAIVNLIGAVVHTVTLSYAALVMTYLYADLRARKAGAEPAMDRKAELPAEIDLGPAT